MRDAFRRDYHGRDDLRAMQRLAERIWSLASHCHIGDLAWQRNEHLGREPEWPTALWRERACERTNVTGDATEPARGRRDPGGQVVAWGWCELPGTLTLLVDPGGSELAGEVLDWFAEVATAAERTVVVLDGETHVLAALARRVAVHRAAWHPSRVTVDSYRNVMAVWPYRATLDWVIEAPDGRFAASCLGWLDARNAVGELEPVGTDPEFRRLGLAQAACLAAMRALRAAGATRAVVYPVHDHPNGAVALYEGLGFTPYARTVTYGTGRVGRVAVSGS